VHMSVRFSNRVRREAQTADHQPLANDHLPLDPVPQILYRNGAPITVLRGNIQFLR
jgi:hypothetical protein